MRFTFFSSSLSHLYRQNIYLFFFSLLLFLGLFPFFMDKHWGMSALVFSMVVIIMAGLRALGSHEKISRYACFLLFFVPSLSALLLYFHSPLARVAGTACVAIFFLLTAIRLTHYVMDAHKFSNERLVSAMCVYILMGIIWAQVYFMLDTIYPGSIALPAHMAAQVMTEGERLHNFLYFSFVTMTTIGYGDIIPVLPLIRSLVILEVILGQFYIVVLIGRIMSSYIPEVRYRAEARYRAEGPTSGASTDSSMDESL